jgi:hypothetical protein
MEITRLASILGTLGLLLTIGGLGLPLLVPEAENSGSIVLGIGTLCLLGYVGIHFQGLVRGSRKRSARLGTHSIIAILLAALAVGLTNFLADKHAPEWDFSETKNFTLSRQTYQVLRDLPREVTIKVFTHEGSPGYGPYHDLLTTYANESPLLIWLPLFNQEEWRSPITWSHALLITFVLDILVGTYFVFGTGGSRESPFQALYFLIPTLAVFLREPVSRVVFYVTLVAIAYSVTSLIANDNHDEARDTRQNLAHWFVSVASFVAAAVIGLLTRPL